MGSYYIPSNKLKGENRILYIFTGKSLIYTGVGALIGLLFYFLFTAFSMKTVGIIIMALLAVTGYGIGTVKMPTSGTSKIAKNVGGDSIDEIIMNYVMFKKNKKVYSYAVPRKEASYMSQADNPSVASGIKDGLSMSDRNTKEVG